MADDDENDNGPPDQHLQELRLRKLQLDVYLRVIKIALLVLTGTTAGASALHLSGLL